MEKNSNPILGINIARLARISTIFCLANSLEVTPKLADLISNAIVAGIMVWYAQHGREDFSLATEIPCQDAVKFAFDSVQQTVNEAREEARQIRETLEGLSAITGIGLE